MDIFAVRAPVIGSVGPHSQWQSGPACPACGRASRTYAPLHFILNRFAGHNVCRLTWHLLLTESLIFDIREAGTILIARDIQQEENLTTLNLDEGTPVPQFKLIELEAIVPNRLSRFCSDCNVSMKGDSQYARLTPASSSSTDLAPNDSGAVLFDTDLPADTHVFSIGREMTAITEVLVPFFENQPEVRLIRVPVMPNPLPPNLSPPDPNKKIEHDW